MSGRELHLNTQISKPLETEATLASPGARLRRDFVRLVLLFCLLLPLAAKASETTNAPPKAKFKVSGYGFLGNFRLKRMLKALEIQKTGLEFFDANFMEDCSLILEAKLRQDGFLQPKITIRIVKEDGTHAQFVWNQTEPLPRPLQARRVEFHIQKGVLFHYSQLEFPGLTALTPKKARSYFIETGGLVPLKVNRAYSPERLKRSVANLSEVMDRMGYQDAKVEVGKLDQDNHTGDVSVRIDVTQGAKFIVRSVRQEVFFHDTNEPPTDVRTNRLHHTFSTWWQQDYTQSLKTNYYSLGYPGTTVALKIERREPAGTNVLLDLLARIETGPRVRLGDVTFRGEKHTRESMLASRVPLQTGQWLNRLDAEQGQYRLARLGVFDTVELNYETVSSNLWDVRYDLKEGKRLEISPLFGFGSYDLLRAGVEVDRYNLWGLAHSDQLKLVQSFKSSSVDYAYTIPQVFGKDVDVFATANYLRRQEISFLRVEYGGGLGGRKYLRDIATDLSLRYNYGLLQATDVNTNLATEGALSPTVGEFILDVRHDRRDNPLDPRHGYQLLANVEVASSDFGGNANFQRGELAGSYHITLNDSEWIHLGLRHGLVNTIGVVSNNLPFTRRFFPGGEDSVRGYQEGEAAPRNEKSQVVGAETYTLGNFEFEQGLTPKWSIVGFVDAVEFAEHIQNYPGNQDLISVGGGIRWHTIIGPVRVEYGHNLNPRKDDPQGTLQFSLGFPF